MKENATMKKALVFLAVATMATVMQAAAVGWTMAGLEAYAGNAYQVFVVGQNGVTSISQITDMIAAGTDVSSYAFGAGKVAANGSASVISTAPGHGNITYSGTGVDSYDAYGIIYDNAVTGDATQFAQVGPKNIRPGNDATSKLIAFGNVVKTGNLSSWSPIPEPTTAALLALGLAAFGLKRKVTK